MREISPRLIIESCLSTLSTMHGKEAAKLEAKLEILRDMFPKESNTSMHSSTVLQESTEEPAKESKPRGRGPQKKSIKFSSRFVTPELLQRIVELNREHKTRDEIVRILEQERENDSIPVPGVTWVTDFLNGKLGYDPWEVAKYYKKESTDVEK